MWVTIQSKQVELTIRPNKLQMQTQKKWTKSLTQKKPSVQNGYWTVITAKKVQFLYKHGICKFQTVREN